MEMPGRTLLTQDRGMPGVPVPAGSWVCLGEGITGKQLLKEEQMDPVALGKALEWQRLRAGAAGVGSSPAVLLPGSCQTQALGQKGSRLDFSGAGKVSFSLVSRGQELAHTRAPQHSAQVGRFLSGTGGMCQILWKLAKSLWDGSFPLLAGPFLGSCLDPGQGLCVKATFALLPNPLFRSLCLFLALFL